MRVKVEPAFDWYVFVEKKQERAVALKALKGEFSNLSSRILIREVDATIEMRTGRGGESQKGLLK